MSFHGGAFFHFCAYVPCTLCCYSHFRLHNIEPSAGMTLSTGFITTLARVNLKHIAHLCPTSDSIHMHPLWHQWSRPEEIGWHHLRNAQVTLLKYYYYVGGWAGRQSYPILPSTDPRPSLLQLYILPHCFKLLRGFRRLTKCFPSCYWPPVSLASLSWACVTSDFISALIMASIFLIAVNCIL